MLWGERNEKLPLTRAEALCWHELEYLGRGNLNWEDTPTRMACGQTCSAFFKLVIGA